MEFAVTNVQVRGAYVVHNGKMEGTLKVGDGVQLQIDQHRWRSPSPDGKLRPASL